MPRPKIHEILFVFAGLALLVSQPWFPDQGGFDLWLAAKASYFLGIPFFIFNR